MTARGIASAMVGAAVLLNACGGAPEVTTTSPVTTTTVGTTSTSERVVSAQEAPPASTETSTTQPRNQAPTARFQLCVEETHFGDPCVEQGQTLSVIEPDLDQVAAVDGSASFDADGTVAAYQWYVNGEPVGSEPLGSFPFPWDVPEAFVTLEVTDNSGVTSSETASIIFQGVDADPFLRWCGADLPLWPEAVRLEGVGTVVIEADLDGSEPVDLIKAEVGGEMGTWTVALTAGATQIDEMMDTEPTVTIGADDLTRDGLEEAILCYTIPGDTPTLHVTVLTFDGGTWVEALGADLPSGEAASYGITFQTVETTTPLPGCRQRLQVEYTTQAIPFHEFDRWLERSGDCGSLNEPPLAALQVCVVAEGRVSPCSVGTEPFLVETDDPDATLSVHPGGTSDPDGTIVAYEWFINGEPASSNPSFVVPIPEADFDLRLVVEDDQGATAEATLRVEVN